MNPGATKHVEAETAIIGWNPENRNKTSCSKSEAKNETPVETKHTIKPEHRSHGALAAAGRSVKGELPRAPIRPTNKTA